MRLSILRRSLPFQLTPSQVLLKEKLDDLRKTIEDSKDGAFCKRFNKSNPPGIKGLYIYGGVGMGKTMIMDMFYKDLNVSKLRVHFHEFMIDVQRELHKHKRSGSTESSLEKVCQDISKKCKVLCLDEFNVTHISDAMILKELFTTLFKLGTILISTSNRAPEELYMNGLNRSRFLPFIPVLYENCQVFNLQGQDFRQAASNIKSKQQVYFVGIDMEKFLEMHKELNKDSFGPGDATKRNESLQITPLRSVNIPISHGSAAFFNFQDLCGSETKASLGTDAFMTISSKFHTIYISQVPKFDASLQLDGRLRSFMLLIDILYEKNIKLVLSLEGPVLSLFGLYGIIKIADRFQKYVDLSKLPKVVTLKDFKEQGTRYGMPEADSERLYNAILEPKQTELTLEYINTILENHETLLSGKEPKRPGLYRFDVCDDSALENEFACSRTLSRLFHMSSQDYLDKHSRLFK
ncbi:ATPase, AFG1 family member protein [Theileria equi strain WA]|uniref:ATPase, AFG1 family member protein n=1 Tax=Theileria equi strain WA TaxID=1537102 RepID=L1L9F7_THEEQ|nr:ATPase, AFG1 family member protein [Theileria equi strain WA]EKX72047.1 ATPase, AFG1 family member protein [Theileria equi strain WA]|eukprot:XP_004831499.1 ATPase, AFG1 family member protein [Theileria equi strain WA]